MKRKYRSITTLFPILFLFASIAATAQTVTLYTPNGSTVGAFMKDEMSSQNITYYTNLYRGSYEEAEVLANASATYNCHSYAWNLSEGGTIVCWLDQIPDLHKYWDDGSYFETTEENAEKIFYYYGDHSAVKSKTVAGKYESKWGAMPLMRHSPGYGPDIYNMTFRKYYARYKISGPSLICSQETYTIDNLSTGAIVTWSSSNTNIAAITTSGNTAAVVRTGNANGSVTLSAIINATATIYKDIWVGAPAATISGPQQLPVGGNGYYRAIGMNSPDVSYQWTVSPSSCSVTSRGAAAEIYYYDQKDYRITLNMTNACGTTTCYYHVATGELEPFSIYPNPASDLLTVKLLVGETESSTPSLLLLNTNTPVEPYTIELWSEHSGLVRMVKSTESIQQVSLKGLPKGMYFVHLKMNNGSVKKKTLWIK